MADIIHRVGIKGSLDRVFDALTSQKGLSGWWTKDVKAEPKLGTILEFRFKDGGPDMKVIDLSPGKRVKWQCTAGPKEWIGTELTFDLRKDADETVVLFGHRNWNEQSEFMAHCSCKWAYFLLSLKSLVEDGRGTPFPEDRGIGSWG